MQLSHVDPVRSAVFDDPGLVSMAGLVPAVALASRARLAELAEQHLTVPGGAGEAAGAKVTALVAGMVAGADSIADMDLLRHGGMGRLFTGVRARSTLGTFQSILLNNKTSDEKINYLDHQADTVHPGLAI